MLSTQLCVTFCTFFAAAATNVPADTASWVWRGPSTYYTRDDPLKITSAGAIQDAAASSNGTWFVGSVNGGVWRTQSIQEEQPQWENVLDGQPVTCSSISALHVSKSDPRRVYAGCGGSTSSEQGYDWNVLNSGEWTGVMVTTDKGNTWKMVDQFPQNFYVTDIFETDPGTILVSAQSHLFDRNEGGIWKVSVFAKIGESDALKKVHNAPTFTLTALQQAGALVATHARNAEKSVSISTDSGDTWQDYGTLSWAEGTYPFYTCAAAMANGDLVVAGLTAQTANTSATNSQFFIKRVRSEWEELANQPTSMDEDGMPKDRMAVLADPSLDDVLYVAGNAGALAWRVNVTSVEWTKMWDRPDVLDTSLPHGDCRNYAWDHESDRLVIVSDGGVFVRDSPRVPGGSWRSLNGNYASMELLSAHYDNREDRFVAGAQDNCAQVTEPGAKPESVAVGFVEGDGTVTAVDNVHRPARLYGTTQFVGVGTISIDPTDAQTVDDDDDNCGGLCFVQGDKFINVPIDAYFPEPSSFPFFVQPYALNSQDPSYLYFWANGTARRKSAFYRFKIAEDVQSKKDIPPPELVVESPEESFFLDFISGGFTSGKADPALLVGVSNQALYVKSSETGNMMLTRPLPVQFAVPVTLPYDATNKGARILGPLTHGRTVSMAVSSSNSNVIAVTGWPSVRVNSQKEEVWITKDAGKSWHNVTRNLRAATNVVGIIRPSGILIVDLLANGARALLVSTTNGVMASFINNDSNDGEASDWSRFGTLSEFPLVLTSALSYEHYSDTLIAATFGRGIYTLKNAKEALLDVYFRKEPNKSLRRVREESSSRFFPPQH